MDLSGYQIVVELDAELSKQRKQLCDALRSHGATISYLVTKQVRPRSLTPSSDADRFKLCLLGSSSFPPY